MPLVPLVDFIVRNPIVALAHNSPNLLKHSYVGSLSIQIGLYAYVNHD